MKTKYGAMAAKVTPIVFIAGIYIGWGYLRRALKGKKKPAIYSRSTSLAALHGGKLALERLIDFHHSRADAAALNEVQKELNKLLAEDHPDFNKLQSTAAKLEMSGKEKVAVEILESKLQDVQKEGKSHEAYEIEMLLAEMYIYKGDWKKALECQCLKHEEISDARRPLYKAIIYLMQNEREEARKCWKEFKSIRQQFLSPDNSENGEILKVVERFDEFQKVIASLKNETTKPQ